MLSTIAAPSMRASLAAPTSRVSSDVRMETVSDLKVLAEKLNPGEWKATPFLRRRFSMHLLPGRSICEAASNTQPPTYSHHHV